MAIQTGNSAKINVMIRWMLEQDRDQVVDIDSCNPGAWSKENLLRALCQRNCVGLIATQGDLVDGFMVYEIHKRYYHILKLVVHPCYRRRGIGRQMLSRLSGKLQGSKQSRARVVVRESNLSAHLFLKECRFEATEVIRGHFDDNGEDAYKFVHFRGAK